MNKKIVTILVLAFVVSTAGVFALGIGAQGGYTVNGGSGALTVKLDGSKWIYAVDAYAGDSVKVECVADNWIANKSLANPIKYFYGWGGAAGVSLGSNLSMTVGARALAGINFYAINNFLEFYAQVAWQPELKINTSGTLLEPVFNNIPVNVGFRFWL